MSVVSDIPHVPLSKLKKKSNISRAIYSTYIPNIEDKNTANVTPSRTSTNKKKNRFSDHLKIQDATYRELVDEVVNENEEFEPHFTSEGFRAESSTINKRYKSISVSKRQEKPSEKPAFSLQKRKTRSQLAKKEPETLIMVETNNLRRLATQIIERVIIG